MMRAHGIAPNAAATKHTTPSRAIKTDRSNSTSKPSKKRKAEAYMDDNGAADDEESFAGNIKSDPVDRKENFMVKEEEHVHGGMKSQSQQLSMHDAAHLMHYYDDASPYNGALAEDYGGEYGGPNGYATAMGGAGGYGMQPHPYNLATAHGAPGFGGGSRAVDPGLAAYQPTMPFPSDSQGRPDSPVIVE